MSESDRTHEALAELLRGERRRSTILTLWLSLLAIAVLFLLWRNGERPQGGRPDGDSDAALVALRTEWQETQGRLEARIRELEGGDAGVGKVADPTADSTAEPADGPGSSMATSEVPSPSINLTGRPDPSVQDNGSSMAGSADAPWQDSVSKALAIGAQIRRDLSEEREDDQGDATPQAADPEESAPSAPNAEGEDSLTPADAVELSLPLLTGLNQFLEDAGLSRHRVLEAKESPTQAGLFEVLMALRPDAANAGGTVRAGHMWLRVHPVSRQGQWILEEAHGTSGGVRIEYPHRTLVIDIAGVVQPNLVHEDLAQVLGLEGGRALPEPTMDTPRITERFNRRLVDEKLELRMVSIGSTEGDHLVDVVVDLGRLPGREQREEVRAARAWWELDEARSVLSLVCEEGSLVRNGVARPFFRGSWKRSYGNIHPAAWKSLPAVRSREAARVGEAGGPDSSGAGG